MYTCICVCMYVYPYVHGGAWAQPHGVAYMGGPKILDGGSSVLEGSIAAYSVQSYVYIDSVQLYVYIDSVLQTSTCTYVSN